jgi:hypothetical protein
MQKQPWDPRVKALTAVPHPQSQIKGPPGIRKPGGPAVSVPINQGPVPLVPLTRLCSGFV